MRLTKYGHACVVLESAGVRLVIDPGSFTDLPDLTDVVAAVVTHEHADHAGTDHLQRLRHANPGMAVLGPAGAAAALTAVEVKAVAPGDSARYGPFDLRFGGGLHAPIHESLPQVDNLTVQVGTRFYHPGDSLEPPAQDVDAVAVPISGPWLKLGEVMDYVLAARARAMIPIHDVHASDAGRGIAYDRLGAIAAERSTELTVLAPGQSIDLSDRP